MLERNGKGDSMAVNVITDVSETRAVLTDENWRVRPPDDPMQRTFQGSRAGEILADFARMSDGESHGPRKQAAIDLIGGMDRSEIPSLARESVSSFDNLLPHDLQFVVPGMIVAGLLGVPVEDREQIVEQVRSLVVAIRPDATPEAIEKAVVDMERALLVLANLSGSTDTEVLASYVSMIFQASDAMAALVGNALLAYSELPTNDPHTGMEIVVQSMAQRVPVRNTRRFQREASVIVDLEHAHTQFPKAGWTFGYGPHACPVRNLATSIAAAIIDLVIECGHPGVRQTGRENVPNVWIPILENRGEDAS